MLLKSLNDWGRNWHLSYYYRRDKRRNGSKGRLSCQEKTLFRRGETRESTGDSVGLRKPSVCCPTVNTAWILQTRFVYGYRLVRWDRSVPECHLGCVRVCECVRVACACGVCMYVCARFWCAMQKVQNTAIKRHCPTETETVKSTVKNLYKINYNTTHYTGLHSTVYYACCGICIASHTYQRMSTTCLL